MTEQNSRHHSEHELLQQEIIDSKDYLATVLGLYRDKEADYRGRRNEDQRFIVEYASEEADEYFDGVALGVLSLTNRLRSTVPVMPDDEKQRDIKLGDIEDGVSLYDMRNAWRELWTGFNVLTNRLARDSEAFQAQGYPEVFAMDGENKKALLDMMFTNFQALNALRFGSEGSGVKRGKFVPDIDGGGEPRQLIFDPDKATTMRSIANNAARRKYTVTVKQKDGEEHDAKHPAGKLTPGEFRWLRQHFNEVDMDKFAFDAAFLRDMIRTYESKDKE